MTEVLERGDIAFFYRPRVRAAAVDAAAPAGVQRFFCVLVAADGRARRLRIGRKHLPSRRGQRFWAEVERVGSLDRVLGDQLEDEHYQTRTRGLRYQPGARPVGRGSYAVIRHGDHCHLAYRLLHLEADDDLPEEVRVADTASYVVLVKATPSARATWTATTDALPDREGAQLVLVASDEPETGVGLDALDEAVGPPPS